MLNYSMHSKKQEHRRCVQKVRYSYFERARVTKQKAIGKSKNECVFMRLFIHAWQHIY